MADVDFARTWDEVDPLLWGGDGTALLAMEWRRLNGDDYRGCQVAVERYRRQIISWRVSEAYQWPQASTSDARGYRAQHPGCSFEAVIAHVAAVERGPGDV